MSNDAKNTWTYKYLYDNEPHFTLPIPTHTEHIVITSITPYVKVDGVLYKSPVTFEFKNGEWKRQDL